MNALRLIVAWMFAVAPALPVVAAAAWPPDELDAVDGVEPALGDDLGTRDACALTHQLQQLLEPEVPPLERQRDRQRLRACRTESGWRA